MQSWGYTMDTITLTAQQALERTISIRCAFILFCVLAVLFLIWALDTNKKAAQCSLARSEAIKAQVHDNNRKERQEWIAANCELAAQVQQLKAAVADLTCENDRMRDILKVVKFADVKQMQEIDAKSKGNGGKK